MRFKLTLHDLTKTHLKQLDAVSDRYIRKWLKIPPCATTAVIHSQTSLNIKSVCHLYKECHSIAHATSRIQADKNVYAALDSCLDHERTWTRILSITTYAEDK